MSLMFPKIKRRMNDLVKPSPKPHKYSAKRVELSGKSFASKLEADTYLTLCLLEKAGEIKIEKIQTQVSLTDAGIIYKPDFLVIDLKNDTFIWVEAKGFETPEWKLKKRLWRYYGPGPLHIYKASRKGPALDEIVEVKQTKEKVNGTRDSNPS